MHACRLEGHEKNAGEPGTVPQSSLAIPVMQPLRQVLVTGATGLIGSWLAGTLAAAGVQVVAAGRVNGRFEDLRNRALVGRGIQVDPGSITDPEACRRMVAGCSHVIHLAAAQHEMNI